MEITYSEFTTVNNLFLILAITFVVWLAQYHWKRRHLYKYAAERVGPRGLPIIGNALLFLGSNHDMLRRTMFMLKKYQTPFPVWIGPKLLYTITEPKDLEIVLNSPHALGKEDLYKYMEPWLGWGLLTAPVNVWKKHRRIIMPTFSQRILNGFMKVFTEQAEILNKQLEKEVGKGYFNAFDYFSKFTLDSVCENAMGVSVNAQTTDSEFVKWANIAMDIMFKRMLGIWYQSDFIFNLTKYSKDLDFYGEKNRKFTDDVITQKKEELRQFAKENAHKPEALIDDAPIKMRNTFINELILSEEGATLSNVELRDEVNTFMIAGSETTASVVCFTLIMLGMHPDIQESVYEEIIDVIGPDRCVEIEDLSRFPYTLMVFKETMRMFPIGALIARKVTQDIRLEKCTIPAGTAIACCLIHTHRDEKLYPDPLKFDPLRFLPEECAKRHPYAYLPFSGGPRNCVGIKYAYMAMKTVIATVIRKYRITTSYESTEDVLLKTDIVLKPVHGYPIALELRE